MREQILSEIRRITTARGGRPPGRSTFEKLTGIRTTDWYGIHWARWGDAVAEAGFERNELQGKLERSVLLRKIAEACRHYGRFPTDGDLRLYGRSTNEFPSHTTISAHFPTKADLVEALRTWFEEQSEFSALSVILPAGKIGALAPKAKKAALGSVYLLQSGQHYKIGRSDELERRIKEIRVTLPEKAELVHTIRTDDPPGIEAYWHRRFADRRASGEWFRLTPADILAFKRRSFQ